jgi:colanic acid/amylovoran biosynthesis protein
MSKLPIIEEADPRILKGIAARCVLMVGSRFHGLVNALSQGVPSIGTSWAHKYEALFADYGRSEWLVDPLQDAERGNGLLQSILQEYGLHRRHLLERSETLRRQTEAMWEEVEAALRMHG